MRRFPGFLAFSALTACSLVVGLDELAGGPNGGDGDDGGTTPIDPGDGRDVASGGDGVAPGDCDKDTSSDPENCGACGRRCLGATCTMGRCPLGLVGTSGFPQGLVATDAGVYVTSDFGDRLLRFPRALDAGSVEVATNDPGGGFFRLAPYTGERLLVVRRTATDAGSNGLWELGGDNAIASIKPEANAYALHVDSQGVYMSVSPSEVNGVASSLRVFTRSPISLVFTASTTTDGAVLPSIMKITSDSTHVYFAQGTTVKRVPKAGPAAAIETIATAPSSVRDIAVDGTHLFLAVTACTTPVYRVDKTKGGLIEPVVTESVCASGLALGGDQLYVAFSRTVDGGRSAGVARVKTSGGALEELGAVDGGTTPYAFAEDGHMLFFATSVDTNYQVWSLGR